MIDIVLELEWIKTVRLKINQLCSGIKYIIIFCELYWFLNKIDSQNEIQHLKIIKK